MDICITCPESIIKTNKNVLSGVINSIVTLFDSFGLHNFSLQRQVLFKLTRNHHHQLQNLRLFNANFCSFVIFTTTAIVNELQVS